MFSESLGRMSGIYQGYTRHMFSESFGNMSGIYSGICQGYTRHISLLVNRPAVAMQSAGCSGLGTGIVSAIMSV
jgi:hypothetical protein